MNGNRSEQVTTSPLIACSGVLLNWKRPRNVRRIVAGWQIAGLAEGIIWNNNHRNQLPAHPWAKVINTRSDFGLYTRFAAACLAQNDCVLLQDDDLELPPASIHRLYAFWKQRPELLHGIFWRKPKRDGSYAIFGKGEQETPIVLTRALMAHRRYAAAFFIHAPRFARIQQHSRPFGNGEDIIFSYVARVGAQGKLHRTYDLPLVELPARYGIHHQGSKQHLAHRTKLLRACEEWLAIWCNSDGSRRMTPEEQQSPPTS
jgi:hypothetical protein